MARHITSRDTRRCSVQTRRAHECEAALLPLPTTLERVNTRKHNPAGLYPKYLGYSHAIEIEQGSRMLFISGLNGYEADGRTMPTSFEDQSELIWSHLDRVLRSARMTVENLVFLRTYLANPEDRFADARIRKKHLRDHEVGLTVVCATLLVPAWKIELEAVAAD